MDCDVYLKRIGFDGFPRQDLATLRLLQRGHLEHIAFENFDVQFGCRVTLDPRDAYAKLVTRGRGGWCYEMNGLFLWALEQIGFRVTAMTGAMMRAQRGPSAIGTHLVLSVELDQPYLVDVGLADGPIEPIPLMEGSYAHERGKVRLERLSDGRWRVHKESPFFTLSFDFQQSARGLGCVERDVRVAANEHRFPICAECNMRQAHAKWCHCVAWARAQED
jgi:N-hydroxyarylamine O-acetyltransferase